MRVNIAGICIELNDTNDYIAGRVTKYLENNCTDDIEQVDMKVSIQLVEKIPDPEGDVIVEDGAIWLRKTGPEEGFFVFARNINDNTVVAMLESDTDWTHVNVSCVETDLIVYSLTGNIPTRWNYYHTFQITGMAFRNLLIKKNGLLIHSSSIEIDGKGLIFSAPSGTGKSTHTRLWKELYGDKVTIVNDDRPAIRYMGNSPMLCGTPWSGSSDLYANRIVPLQGIVLIEQSSANSIEKLPVAEGLQMLMPRCFLPYYDRDMMNEAMNTLERLITDVPVYRLKCRPDYEAVELVRKCMM